MNEVELTAIEDLIMAAKAHDAAGAFPEAAELWREILGRDPHHQDRAFWEYSYAEALRQSGEESRAAEVFRRIQDLYPERTEGFVGLALLHQRSGAFDQSADVWRQLLTRWPSHQDRRWWLAAAAYALIELAQLDEAEALCLTAITEFSDSPDGYAPLSLVAERRFQWKDALLAIDKATSLSPSTPQASFIASKARILRDMGATAYSEEILSSELSVRAPSAQIMQALAQLKDVTGPLSQSANHWERCIQEWPDDQSGYIGRAQLHRRMGELEAGLTLLTQACQRWPRSSAIRQEIAETLAQDRQLDAAKAEWLQALHLAPSSLPLRLAYCRFLGSVGARDLLEQTIRDGALPEIIQMRCRYEYAKAARELDSAISHIERIRHVSPSNAPDALAEAELRSWRQDGDDLEIASRILHQLMGVSPNGVYPTALLVRVLVLLGETDAASDIVRRWPHDCEHAAFSDVLLWFSVHHEDFEAAHLRWQEDAGRFFMPAIHLPAAELQLVRSVGPAGEGDSIQLLSIIRNELPRLHGFLAHHRNLGVARFVLIDNGSTDGSLEYLAAQPDVILYSTQDGYARSAYGMRWLNQLIDRHAGTGWAIHADADERLVHACGDRSLTEIAAHMTRMGDEIVPAVMIDMFPHRPASDTPDGQNTAGPVETWFDPPRIRRSTRCPYIEAAGGARRRLFGTTVTLSKAPMIRTGAGIRYLSAHEVTPGRVADVRMALLHHHLDYVLSAETLERVRDEVQRGQHADFAVDRRRMLGQLETLSHQDLAGPESLRYAGVAQLLALGLITAGSIHG